MAVFDLLVAVRHVTSSSCTLSLIAVMRLFICSLNFENVDITVVTKVS